MTAEERIKNILDRQQQLQESVKSAQSSLLTKLLNKLQVIAINPAAMNVVFRTFYESDYLKVITQFANDIVSIGRSNGEYFTSVLEGEIVKDYEKVKLAANDFLLERFGINKTGGVVKDGFFDAFLNDKSVELEAKRFAYQSVAKKGVGLDKFKEGLSEIIEGDATRAGGFERHFNRYAYDTYQQADSLLQETYAVALELPAAFYSGGLIRDSRPFCKERNGNVYTRQEILAWDALKWQGKIPDVSILVQRGGYNCRHHFSYLTAKQALRRRPDLELAPDGLTLQSKIQKLPV